MLLQHIFLKIYLTALSVLLGLSVNVWFNLYPLSSDDYRLFNIITIPGIPLLLLLIFTHVRNWGKDVSYCYDKVLTHCRSKGIQVKSISLIEERNFRPYRFEVCSNDMSMQFVLKRGVLLVKDLPYE